MSALRYAAVLELSRSEVSLALIDLITYREIKARKLQIRPLRQPYLHFDAAEIWKFLVAGLKHYQSGYDINAISFSSSVAAMALLDGDNALVLPVLHPDDPGPAELRGVYEQVRPKFAETASASSPDSCGAGHQLFWQSRTFPDDFRKVAAIVPWPQYWAWRASDALRAETTSFGASSDLWVASRNDWSSLATETGWSRLFAANQPAMARLADITPELAAATGLERNTGVWTGAFSTASAMLPHVLSGTDPRTVVMSGPTFTVTAIRGGTARLDSSRGDFLASAVTGSALPTAAFQGGLEFSGLTGGAVDHCTEAELESVIVNGTRVDRGSQTGLFRWNSDPAALSPGQLFAASSLFLARETTSRLAAIGALGPLVVEGPFTRNTLFLDAVSVLSGRPVFRIAGNATGSRIGAALLVQRPERLGQVLSCPLSAQVQALQARLLAGQAPRT